MSHYNKGEFYCSLDVETFGPCASIHPMVQIGATFFGKDGLTLAEFSANLDEDGFIHDPDTMQFWDKQEQLNPGTMARLLADRIHPKEAMSQFTALVETLEDTRRQRVVVVAYPATFDFQFIYYYLWKYTGKSCVGISALDIKTLTMPLFAGKGYRGYGRKDFPAHWRHPDLAHTHNALDDAREQAYMFKAVMRDLKL